MRDSYSGPQGAGDRAGRRGTAPAQHASLESCSAGSGPVLAAPRVAAQPGSRRQGQRAGRSAPRLRHRTGRCGRGSTPSLLPENVAYAAQGLDDARGATVLQLLPQVADVYVDHVAGGAKVEAPDGVHDPLAGEHLPGIAHEQLQQVELLGGQGDDATVPLDL